MKPPTNLGKLKVIGIREKSKGKALFPCFLTVLKDLMISFMEKFEMSRCPLGRRNRQDRRT